MLIENGGKRLTRHRVTGGESDAVRDGFIRDGFCHCQKEKPDDARGDGNVSPKHRGDGSSNRSLL